MGEAKRRKVVPMVAPAAAPARVEKRHIAGDFSKMFREAQNRLGQTHAQLGGLRMDYLAREAALLGQAGAATADLQRVIKAAAESLGIKGDVTVNPVTLEIKAT